MATDQERAEELLHFISNEPRHGDALAAIVKEFENVRQATLAAYVRAHVPFRHDTDGPSAMEAIANTVFSEELERHRSNIERMPERMIAAHVPNSAIHYDIAQAIRFLLALAHPPVLGGVVEVGGSSPKHEYARCTAICEEYQQCTHPVGHPGPHKTESGQRWEIGDFGIPRKLSTPR